MPGHPNLEFCKDCQNFERCQNIQNLDVITRLVLGPFGLEKDSKGNF